MLSANLTDGLLNKCPRSSKYLDSNIIKHHQIVNIQVPAVWALLKFLPSNSRFENPCQHRSDHSLVKNLIFKLWCMQMSGSKPDSFLDISCFFWPWAPNPRRTASRRSSQSCQLSPCFTNMTKRINKWRNKLQESQSRKKLLLSLEEHISIETLPKKPSRPWPTSTNN